jgi:hypothetical protein
VCGVHRTSDNRLHVCVRCETVQPLKCAFVVFQFRHARFHMCIAFSQPLLLTRTAHLHTLASAMVVWMTWRQAQADLRRPTPNFPEVHGVSGCRARHFLFKYRASRLMGQYCEGA